MLQIKRVLVQDGSNIRKVDMVEGKPVELDAGVYTITEDKMGIIISPDRDKFKIPARLYEPVYGLARRFMGEIDKGYKKGLSLIADGSYGVGKSQLAEVLANHVIGRGGIVIYVNVNRPVVYEQLAEVIWTLGDREVLVYFDEFGRIYPTNTQENHYRSSDFNPRRQHNIPRGFIDPQTTYGSKDVGRGYADSHAMGNTDDLLMYVNKPPKFDIESQNVILPFFSDDSFEHVHKVITSNGKITAAMHNRPQRIKYYLSDSVFEIGYETYGHILNKAKIRGESAQYLMQAMKLANFTIDEAMRTAEVCQGVKDIEEMSSLLELLNTRELPDNFHAFFVEGAVSTHTKLHNETMDGRYEVTAVFDDEGKIVQKTFITDYPLTDELVNSVTVVSEDGETHGQLVCSLVPKSIFQNDQIRKVDLTVEQYTSLWTYYKRS